MIDMFARLLAPLAGLIVFAGAYFVHQKIRLTRAGCVAACVGGFITATGVVGSWVNQYAAQFSAITAVGVFVGICVIVADIKGKRKGADRPALFAFFLVPVFLVAGLFAISSLLTNQFAPSLREVGNNIQQQAK